MGSHGAAHGYLFREQFVLARGRTPEVESAISAADVAHQYHLSLGEVRQSLFYYYCSTRTKALVSLLGTSAGLMTLHAGNGLRGCARHGCMCSLPTLNCGAASAPYVPDDGLRARVGYADRVVRSITIGRRVVSYA